MVSFVVINREPSVEPFTISPATEADVPLLMRLIKALAEYEKLAHEVVATEDGLREARLHVPIRTNKRVQFRVGGKDIFMRPGELWYIDVSQPHSAGNGGRTPRVHLVVDCVVNDWLRNLIEA